jgi:hypothetical protein
MAFTARFVASKCSTALITQLGFVLRWGTLRGSRFERNTGGGRQDARHGWLESKHPAVRWKEMELAPARKEPPREAGGLVDCEVLGSCRLSKR